MKEGNCRTVEPGNRGNRGNRGTGGTGEQGNGEIGKGRMSSTAFMIQIIKAAFLTADQKEKILQLWNQEYPEKLAITAEGFDLYLQNLVSPKHFIVHNIEDEIAGWAFSFDRDGDRWFSIIVEGRFHGMGLGRQLLALLKENDSRLNGWVIDHEHDVRKDGKSYRSPIQFYLRNGFQINHNVRYDSNELSAIKIQWNRTNLVSDSFDID